MTAVSEHCNNAENSIVKSIMLQINNLGFEYNDRVLFSQLHLQLQPGEVLQIYGANGTGKTTLLRLICGLLTPMEGYIFWQGNCTRKHRAQYFAQLHYIGHQTAIKKHLTVAENLQLMQALTAVPAKLSFTQALQQMGLSTDLHALAGNFSVGQQRRLLLSKLILFPATLWILDEPFAGLDQESVNILQSLILQHVKNNGMVILTSHQEFKLDNIKLNLLLL